MKNVVYEYSTVVAGQVHQNARPQGGMCPIADSTLRFFEPFEQYDPQSYVLFDNLDFFSGSKSQTNVLNSLEKVTSKYPITVQIKGSSLWYKPDTIYITSRLAPNIVYREAGEGDEEYSIMRNRITACICKEKGVRAKSVNTAGWEYCVVNPVPPPPPPVGGRVGGVPLPHGVVGLGVGRLGYV